MHDAKFIITIIFLTQTVFGVSTLDFTDCECSLLQYVKRSDGGKKNKILKKNTTLRAPDNPLAATYTSDDLRGDPVNAVSIDNCFETPCIMKIGESYRVRVQPEYINPQVDDTTVEIGILQYGAYFRQPTHCDNPCIYSCPITTKLIEPDFDVNFTVSSSMIPLNSLLVINTTYYKGYSPTIGFCVYLDVILRK